MDSRDLYFSKSLIAYPYHWQESASTEKLVFEQLRHSGYSGNANYVAFPWSSLINALLFKDSKLLEILVAMHGVLRQNLPEGKQLVTVSQHPDTMRFQELFLTCNITVLLTPHKSKDISSIQKLQIKPFPLLGVQDVENFAEHRSNPKYLLNFVGAYDPLTYLSEMRDYILSKKAERNDYRIFQRPQWHYLAAVSRQHFGTMESDEKLNLEDEYRKQFLNVIKQSDFTLCPTGRGLCTTRIFEALSGGSIPVVLSTVLDLPGNQILWNKACIIEQETKEGLDRALETIDKMSPSEIESMRQAGKELHLSLNPSSYCRSIMEAIGEAS
jgi:hypothetical protein|tara:strand:+ start:1813 stop:2793 length:981 start_codon:yes stop_codon:yes gene_type:complete